MTVQTRSPLSLVVACAVSCFLCLNDLILYSLPLLRNHLQREKSERSRRKAFSSSLRLSPPPRPPSRRPPAPSLPLLSSPPPIPPSQECRPRFLPCQGTPTSITWRQRGKSGRRSEGERVERRKLTSARSPSSLIRSSFWKKVGASPSPLRDFFFE